jgi:hypothetical protein
MVATLLIVNAILLVLGIIAVAPGFSPWLPAVMGL